MEWEVNEMQGIPRLDMERKGKARHGRARSRSRCKSRCGKVMKGNEMQGKERKRKTWEG
jgi:hypothetical protein